MIPGPGDRIGVGVGGAIVGVGKREHQLTLFGNLQMAGITRYQLITNDDGIDLVGGVITSNAPFILPLSGRVLE